MTARHSRLWVLKKGSGDLVVFDPGENSETDCGCTCESVQRVGCWLEVFLHPQNLTAMGREQLRATKTGAGLMQGEEKRDSRRAARGGDSDSLILGRGGGGSQEAPRRPFKRGLLLLMFTTSTLPFYLRERERREQESCSRKK